MKKLLAGAFVAAALVTSCKKTDNTTTVTGTTATDNAAATPDNNMNASDANNQVANNLSAADNEFAHKAAMGGMMEVMMGNLARTNATNQQVKDFGQRMVTDHTKANDDLKAWAAQNNVNLPNALNTDMQQKYDELKSKTGADFDKAYTSMMVDDHKKDISDYRKAADGSDNTDLRNYASRTLPVLEEHLQMVERIHSTVK